MNIFSTTSQVEIKFRCQTGKEEEREGGAEKSIVRIKMRHESVSISFAERVYTRAESHRASPLGIFGRALRRHVQYISRRVQSSKLAVIRLAVPAQCRPNNAAGKFVSE